MLDPMFSKLVESLTKEYSEVRDQSLRDPYLTALERIADALEAIAKKLP